MLESVYRVDRARFLFAITRPMDLANAMRKLMDDWVGLTPSRLIVGFANAADARDNGFVASSLRGGSVRIQSGGS